MTTSLLLAACFAVSALGPGFLLVRRLPLEPDEKLTAAIGLSLLLVFTASFGLFAVGLPPAAHWGILFACAGLTAACGGDLARFLREGEVRAAAGWYIVVAGCAVGLAALVRNYSGGGWYGDWLEHYQRSLFFLDRPGPETLFQGGFTVPSRPPLMNVLCAYLISLAGRSFPTYQAASCLLNALVWFPAFLMARRFSRKRGPAPALLAAFILFNPMLAQNMAYGWTKLLTAFFVVAAIRFYVEGWKGGASARLALAALFLAAGAATHYSAAPYALFLGAHYAVFVLPRRASRGREMGILLLCAAAALGPWLAWSLAHYGGATFTATSTYADAADKGAAENLGKIGRNIRNSLVPHLMRGVEMEALNEGPSWGGIRDAAFKLYQSNLIFGFGSLGLILILVSLLSRSRRGEAGERPPGAAFWLSFLAFTIVVGIAVHGDEDKVGLAHICLQPLVVLGVAWTSAGFGRWPAGLKLAAAAGLLLDALLGIALHFWFQSVTFGAFPEGGGPLGMKRADLLVGSVYANWKLKEKTGLVYMGDLFVGQAPLLAVLLAALYAFLLVALLRRAPGVAAPGRKP